MKLFAGRMQTVAYGISVAASRLAAFAIVVVFSRVLGPERFGYYALLVVYGELLDAVLSAWIRLGVLRFVSDGSTEASARLLRAVVALLPAFVVVGAVGASVVAFTSSNTADLVFAGMLQLYFVATMLGRLGLQLLRGQGRSWEYCIGEVSRSSLGVGFAFLLVSLRGPSYVWVALGTSSAAMLVGGVVFWRAIRGSVRGERGWLELREMLRYAAPLLLVFMGQQAIAVSDRFLLNLKLGPAAVGVFAAGYALARPTVDVLFSAVNLGSFPRLLRAFEKQGRAAASSVMRQTAVQLMFLVSPVVVGACLFAKPIAALLLSRDYQAEAPLVIHLISIAAFFAGMKSFLFDQIFHLTKNSLIQCLTLLPAVLLNVAITLVLLPRIGVVGAAWGTLAGYVVAAALSWGFSMREMPVPLPGRELLWIGCALLSMAVVCLLIQWNAPPERLLVTVPVGACVYWGVCAWAGVLGSSERALPSEAQ